MEKVYIYSLEHPITKEVRYIGKTKNPKERFHNHCNRLHNEHTYKRNWINSLRSQGLKPKMNILDEIDESEWKYWEKFWIEQFRQWGFNLVNHTSGGDGLTMGNETSFKKGSTPWNKGRGTLIERVCQECNINFKPQTNKSTQKYCSYKCAAKNRKTSTQFIKNSTPWNKGIIGIKLKPDKNIYQFNKEKTIMIKKWNTAKEAGTSLNINVSGIGQCARGVSKSSGGYYWNYKNILL